LEKRGYTALPIDPGISDFARDVEIIQEKPEPEIKMLGDFSHRHAAVKAGLGQFGLASYVVTKPYGPRIRFASLISNASLEPDAVIEKGTICDPESCDHACVRACPPGALRGDGTIDHFKCRNYREPELFTLEYFKDINEISVKESSLIRRITVLSKKHASRNTETCGICIKVCPIGIST
jgi:epoxyqueuosine reductase QueG